MSEETAFQNQAWAPDHIKKEEHGCFLGYGKRGQGDQVNGLGESVHEGSDGGHAVSRGKTYNAVG